jgi:IS1 family transposase/transposase-like protein
VQTEEQTCPRCGAHHIKKNGTTAQGKQRYRCKEWGKECGKQFLFVLNYTYRACIPFLRELIVPMALNGSGVRDVVRDVARVLRISPTTVLEVLRQAAAATPEPRVPWRIKELELDEQWSFVHDKQQQYWLWYGLNRRTGRIAAFVLGRRTDRSCRQLCHKLTGCQVQAFYTDDWKSYGKCLNPQRHHIGKSGTQNIERKNLNFRTHLKRLQRRTICFSKSPEMHEAVLKLYIHHCNTSQHHF